MNILKTNRLSPALCAVFLASTIAGCAQQEQEEPPDLPPVGSLQAEVKTMQSAPVAAKNANPEGDGEYTNFANAWVRVAYLRVGAAVVLALPVASMALTLSQDPEFDGDSWNWSLTVLNTTADLELSGDLVNGWDVAFYVTNPEVTRFLWIEGHANPTLTEGTWTGHSVDLPAGDDAVLDINWSYTSETERSVSVSNVNSESPDFGDLLTYTLSGTSATILFDDASAPNQVATISVDTLLNAGSIQVPLYNDGAEACWDESFLNVTCQ